MSARNEPPAWRQIDIEQLTFDVVVALFPLLAYELIPNSATLDRIP